MELLISTITSIKCRLARQRCVGHWTLLLSALCACSLVASPRAHAESITRANLRGGQEIYQAACAACHGANGAGTPETTAGFERPKTFPDFTKCDQTTPEFNHDYRAVIRDGGPARGFSQIMPSFGAALTEAQIDQLVKHLRSFCAEPHWPRGELNVPRALATEKAFPESEVALTSTLDVQGPAGIDNEFVYEYRFAKFYQAEVVIPFALAHQDTGGSAWGLGDIAFGLKRVLYSKLAEDEKQGSILSFQGEVAFPTGDKTRNLGTGETAFTGFLAYDLLFPGELFLQLQDGVTLPLHNQTVPKSVFARTALGKSLREQQGYGRIWSPMLEILGARDLESGAHTQWDVMPEVQVTLSRRQHVRADLGYRMPVNEKTGRPRQVMFYVLWDWADGSLFEGW